MKHLLRILPITLLAVACNDEIEHGTPIIGFDAQVEHTRAVADINSLQANGFSVWGGYDGTTVFDGRKVSYASGAWTYDNPEVWVLDKEYHFFAVYPDKERNAYSINDDIYSITYDVKAKQEDLLVAKATAKYNGVDEPPIVAFEFEHTLAQLEFVGSSTATQQFASISSIKLYGEGIPSSAILNATSNTYQWSSRVSTTSDSPFLYSDNASQGWRLTNSGTTVLSEVLVFPKSETNVTVEIAIGSEIKTATLSDSLESGKKYRYTFSVDPYDYIIFNKPIITEWQTATAGSVVIK